MDALSPIAELPEATYALALGEPDVPVPMPGSFLERLAECDIWIGPPALPNLTVVRKIRLSHGDLGAFLGRVRGAINARRRRSARWWITPLSTPTDLVQELSSHALKSEGEPITAMVARCSSVSEGTGSIEVRRAETPDDYLACSRIGAVAFGTEPPEPEAVASVFEAENAEERVAAYMALIDGRPVATARATFSPSGVTLNGGATLPEARGRGAYRALVAARCRDAEARSIDWVVVQARPSAAPILLRLGFEPVGQIQVLLDKW